MRYRVIFLIIIVAAYCPARARADEFRLVPSISVKEDYNSNILLSISGVRSDYITTLSPGVEMVDRTERLDTDLQLRVDRLQYINNSGLSATNYLLNGGFRYSVTPLLNVSAGAGYNRDSNPTLNIASTGFVSAAVPVNRISSSLSADYKFTEMMGGTVSYNYGTDIYNNRGFLNDISHTVNTGLVYDFGRYCPTLTGRMNVGYSYYAFPGSRTDSVIGTVGFSRDFNEIWNLSADAGIRRTWSKTPLTQYVSVFQLYNGQPYLVLLPETEQVKNGGWGWVGNVGLHYKTEHGGGDLTYTRDIIPAYGLNGSAEQNALAISSHYQLTYEFSALFSTGYYTLKSAAGEFSSSAIKQHTFRINPGVRYEFSRAPLRILSREKDMAVEASYEYTMVDNRVWKTEANRHVVTLRLSLQHPFFE